MKTRQAFLAITLVLAFSLQVSFGAIVMGGRASNGTLDNSGTNKNPAPFNLGSYTGMLGGSLGTPISPTHFITATHIGDGGSGGVFSYADGGTVPQNYNVTIAGQLNDLTIWKIVGPQTFSHWTHVYSANTEVNQPVVFIGNGTTRGAPVNTPNTSNLAGWEWGAGGTLRSWGTNTITSTVNVDIGAPFQGSFLYFTFDRVVDGNGNLVNHDEGIFSGGDSGGPTFVLDPNDNQWKLAGINSLVDAVSATPNGTPLANSLFDARGFYDGATLLDGNDPIPFGSYATRLSSRIDFINSIAAVPEPGTLALFAILAVPGVLVILRQRKLRRLTADEFIA